MHVGFIVATALGVMVVIAIVHRVPAVSKIVIGQ